MTVLDAAKLLGLSEGRIRYLILYEPRQIKAEKRGRDWWIELEAIEEFKANRAAKGDPRQQTRVMEQGAHDERE